MDFLLQTPAPDSGTTIKYDPESFNFFTVNESTADNPFYQTFGDLVLNFDSATGRLLSIDGRINLEQCTKEDFRQQTPDTTAYLVAGSLEMKHLTEGPRYAFDPKENILSVSNPQVSKDNLRYALVFSNVLVALTSDGQLVDIRINLNGDE